MKKRVLLYSLRFSFHDMFANSLNELRSRHIVPYLKSDYSERPGSPSSSSMTSGQPMLTPYYSTMLALNTLVHGFIVEIYYDMIFIVILYIMIVRYF